MPDRISDHISFREGVFSPTAKRFEINNIPDEEQLANMKLLAEKVFEPLRNHFGVPIRVNSFFRSKKLNARVGGSKRSQHIKGQAIDIDDTFKRGVTNKLMFDWIVTNLDFDQIIWEFGNNDNPDWIHISYVSSELNRNRKLRAKRVPRKKKKGNKTIYEVIP